MWTPEQITAVASAFVAVLGAVTTAIKTWQASQHAEAARMHAENASEDASLAHLASSNAERSATEARNSVRPQA